MSNESLILVTGISGYLGAHVAQQLLEAGYRVRGTARSRKVALIQKQYSQYGHRVKIVAIDDLVSGDYSDALKGINAVIHLAAPLPDHLSQNNEDKLNAAILGTRNILVQGEAAGITRFAIASSIITVSPALQTDPRPLLTAEDWNPVTRELALDPAASPFTVYGAEKVLAEQGAWEFAEKHPHVDITTVNPPFFIGPFAPAWIAERPGVRPLSSNFFIYDLLRRSGPAMMSPATIDVRDVARGLVLALTAPPTSKVGRKRILMSGEWFGSSAAVEYIAKARPALKDRLSEIAKVEGPIKNSNIDNSRAKEVLGWEPTDWHKTVLDAVDSLIALETDWKSQGWIPPDSGVSSFFSGW